VSVNNIQNIKDIPIITDLEIYKNIGPMAALLSAFALQKTDWLVVAIDYPMLQSADINTLVSAKNLETVATIFYNKETNFYEPYIGIYNVKMYDVLLAAYKSYNYSLQKILQQNNITKVQASSNASIKSVDTIEEKNNL
jgi:molybdopterin-guanine dinucleotide biosynthesis protein A